MPHVQKTRAIVPQVWLHDVKFLYVLCYLCSCRLPVELYNKPKTDPNAAPTGADASPGDTRPETETVADCHLDNRAEIESIEEGGN